MLAFCSVPACSNAVLIDDGDKAQFLGETAKGDPVYWNYRDRGDGTHRLHEWKRWRLREDALFAREGTRAAADVLVDGAPTEPHDPDQEFVVLELTI